MSRKRSTAYAATAPLPKTLPFCHWYALWEGIVKGIELQRQQQLSEMIRRGTVDPEWVAQWVGGVMDFRFAPYGRTAEQRFSYAIGKLSASLPAFRVWWNTMNRAERLHWRLRNNLGGTLHPGRLKEAMEA